MSGGCFTSSTCHAAKTFSPLLSSNTCCAAYQTMSSKGVRAQRRLTCGTTQILVTLSLTRWIGKKKGNGLDVFAVALQVFQQARHARQKAGAAWVEMKLAENRYWPPNVNSRCPVYLQQSVCDANQQLSLLPLPQRHLLSCWITSGTCSWQK